MGVDSIAAVGRIVQRAYFEDPEPPPSFELPADADSASLIRNGCTLTATRLEIFVARAGDAPRVFEEVRREFARSGEKIAARWIDTLGAGKARLLANWRINSLTVRATFDGGSSSADRHIAVLAYYPRSHQSDYYEEDEDAAKKAVNDARPFRQDPYHLAAIRTAITSNDSLAAFSALERKPTSDTSRLNAMREWIARSRTGNADRRAAALLAADFLAAPWVAPEDSALAAKYKSLGETYWQSEIGGWTYMSYRNLLDSAVAAAPESPAGRMGRLLRLQSGFNLGGGCQGGNSPFRRVIKEGLRFLENEHDPATRAEVNLLIGHGYADIVALGRGWDPTYEDPAPFIPEIPEARRQAIAYMRAGLALDHSMPTAAASWKTAWRLLAGLSPAGTAFWCVYD